MTQTKAFHLSLSGQRAPIDYDRAPTYSGMIVEKDVLVPMRDGVKIAIDVYRPDTTDKLPALLAFSIHNKDLQGPDLAEASLTHPAWSMLWTGPAEAGDTRFFVGRGYVHVIGNPRGIAKSEGGGSRAFRQLRSDRMDWGAALVRRQCGDGGHFRLRRRAAHGGEAQFAASQGDLSVRSARRLWRSGRLPRRVSWRRLPSVSVSAAGLCLGP